MTSSEINRIPFNKAAVDKWSLENSRNTNWPVVYTINNDSEIYIGETTNALVRMRQHLATSSKSHLREVKILVDESYNKSACLDLESHLIRFFAADGKYSVLNGNGGLTDADYYQREIYRDGFSKVFQELIDEGALTRSIPEIVNSDLFKYSPFKALTTDQAVTIEAVLEQLFDEMSIPSSGPIVIQGDPGTGKTIVAVYLMKLLADIERSRPDEVFDVDSLFADFFQEGYRQELTNVRLGLVIPQQSLRKSIQRVFAKTPGLDKKMVLNPFDLGDVEEPYDLLIVDEAHRLQRRANQPSASLNAKFAANNKKLLGADKDEYTQLDWVLAASKHQILLLDPAQSVKPADLPVETTVSVIQNARKSGSCFALTSQMRVAGGADYIEYITQVLDETRPQALNFERYDLRLFNSISEMKHAVEKRNSEVGLSRLVAGYAWPWVTKKNPDGYDIELEDQQLVWNRTATDWINSPTSIDEVGSIHTVQGYDLNYAGVIIGPDLALEEGQIIFKRENYHDKKGKENNPRLRQVYTDDELLSYVKNIYRVLLTRGILGTYVYVVDPELREYLRRYIPSD